jgi:hypothetical protein
MKIVPFAKTLPVLLLLLLLFSCSKERILPDSEPVLVEEISLLTNPELGEALESTYGNTLLLPEGSYAVEPTASPGLLRGGELNTELNTDVVADTPKYHITSGPDASKYLPVGYTMHITSGPDISKYLPPGYTVHIGSGPDKSKYIPTGYNSHIAFGPDATKYLPAGYIYHVMSGPDKSKYSNVPQTLPRTGVRYY